METKQAQKLVEHFGGKAQTAEAMKVSGETVRLWLRDGLPLHRAIDFEEKSGGVVTAEAILEEAKAAARDARGEERAA